MIEAGGARLRLFSPGPDTDTSTHSSDITTRLGSPRLSAMLGNRQPYGSAGGFMKPIHISGQAVCAHRDLGSNKASELPFGTFQPDPRAIDQPPADLKPRSPKAYSGAPDLGDPG